jgi:hypothetical protein
MSIRVDRPGEDRFAFLRQPRPRCVHLLRCRRLAASRHKAMQPVLHQISGHAGALFGKAKMEIFDAVEMAAAPLPVDARHFLVDPASVRIAEFATRDAGDPRRIETLDLGRRQVAAEDTILRAVHQRYSAMKRLTCRLSLKRCAVNVRRPHLVQRKGSVSTQRTSPSRAPTRSHGMSARCRQ